MTRLRMTPLAFIVASVALSGCTRFDHVGRPPTFEPNAGSYEHRAMSVVPLPETTGPVRTVDRSSLWSGDQRSLLGDRRARNQGDLLTVVIEIDDEAKISNSTERSRSSENELRVPQFLGIPQRLAERLPQGAGIDPAVSTSSSSGSEGSGSVRRSEELTLRVAATVVEVMANGALRIEGSQEIRVNFELRELVVSGYIRPEDVSRRNEVTYDKIAGARISYGGRGQITDVQQPRIGQQIADVILPF